MMCTGSINANATLGRITLLRLGFFLPVLLCLVAISAVAQTYTTTTLDGATPPGAQAGAPTGSFPLSGFDTVNLFNGNLNFRIPLVHVGGRGSAGYTMTLALNTKQWQIYHQHCPSCIPIDSYFPTPYGWMTAIPGYAPGILFGRTSGGPIQNGACSPASLGFAVTQLTFITPDGTSFELRDVQTSGAQLFVPPNSCFGQSRGSVFSTFSGPIITFISEDSQNNWVPITDPSVIGYTFPSGLLFFPDGTKYRIDGGAVSWIEDRNGNKTTFTYNNITPGFNPPGGAPGQVTQILDSLGRKISISYADFNTTFADIITYSGFGGAQRTITVNHDLLANLLRPGSGDQTLTYASLFPDLNGSSTTVYNPDDLVSSVVLPNGQSYSFTYNPWGEVNRVVLPTGGAYEYDYVTASAGPGDDIAYRRITSRRVYLSADPGVPSSSEEGQTTYAYTITQVSGKFYQSTTATQVNHEDPTGAPLAEEVHTFYGDPGDALSANFAPGWWEGKEFQTDEYDTTKNVVLHSSVSTWSGTTISWFGGTPQADNALVNEIDVTLKDTGQVSKEVYAYDQYNNKTDTTTYDYSGVELKHIRETYLTSGYDTITNGQNPIHIRSFPLNEKTFGFNPSTQKEFQLAETDYQYDASGVVSLINPAVGHDDANYGQNFSKRGNVTQITDGLGADQTNTTSQYDILGNVVSTTDGDGNTKKIDYTDDFSTGPPDGITPLPSNTPPSALNGQMTYAFVTTVTNALSQQTYNQYDYYSGALVEVQDLNKVLTTLNYQDRLDRPTQITRGSNHSEVQAQTSFIYNDSLHTIQTTSDLAAFNDGLLTSTATYDGLGRTTKTDKTDATQGDIVVQVFYDAMGRSYKTSNPYRSTGDSTYGTTVTTFDSLSRPVRVETFDSSTNSTGAIVTAYSGNTGTVTDQAGIVRVDTNDALGRPTAVTEDPLSAPHPAPYLNYQTLYQHDALGNLTQVNQTSQQRTFAYDSLSRVTSVSNPEQDAPVTFSYDGASNMLAKKDPRGFTVNYTYDKLNRVQTRSYTDGITPAVSYAYDTATLGVGRLQSITTAGSNAPILSTSAYDALGRPINYSEQVGGTTYALVDAYNRAGMVTDETYPSLKKVHTDYDSVGRVAGITRSGAPNYYAGAQSGTGSIQYAPNGAATSVPLGNGLVETTTYNSRFQITEARLGSPSALNSIWDLILNYTGPLGNNGSLQTQTINVGTSLIAKQSYTYDAADRLATISEIQGNQGTTWSETFGYDAYGNMAVTGASAIGINPATPQALSAFNPASNRMDATNFTYDRAGNVTIDGQLNSYAYDAENHMTSCTVGGVQSQYTYDGIGRRISKTNVSTGATTYFIYNAASNLIAEYGSQTDPGNGGTDYVTLDHVGSARVITNSSGQVVARHDYLPFGQEIGVTVMAASIGARTSTQGYATPDDTADRFCSQRRDNESGLDYFGARYLSSSAGRFLSADPVALAVERVADPQRINLYSYCRNNPHALTDPSGEYVVAYDEASAAAYQAYKDFLLTDPVKYQAQLCTIERLEKSTIWYVVRAGGPDSLYGGEGAEAEGVTAPDADGHVIMINIRNHGGPNGERFSINERFAHELEHARQFDAGEIAFWKKDGRWAAYPKAYDILDEVKAFEAQLDLSVPAREIPLMRDFRLARTDHERAAILEGAGYSNLRDKGWDRGVDFDYRQSAKEGIKAGQIIRKDNFWGVVRNPIKNWPLPL